MADTSTNKTRDPSWYKPGYAWYVVGVLLLAYTFSFVDRQILSLLVEPIEHDLQINDTQMSLLQGFAFALLYIVMGLPIARWADVSKRTRIILLGVIVWSLTTAACGLAASFGILFILRVGVGIGEATLVPASFSLFSDYFPARKLGMVGGIFSTGIYLGGGLAFLIGGMVVHALSGISINLPMIGTRFPWQLVFFMVGLPGLLVALLVMTIREPPRRRQANYDHRPSLSEVWHYWLNNWRTFISHNVGFAMLAMVSYGSAAWIPTFFIRDHGWSAGKVGIVFGSIGIIFGTSGIVFGGWLSDWFVKRGRSDGRMRVGLVAALGAAIPTIVYPLVPSPVTAAVILAPALFLSTLGWGAAPAGLQEIAPNRMRAQFTALYVFVTNLIGLGLGPTSYALVTDYVLADPASLRYSLSIVSFVGFVLASLLFLWGLKHYRNTLAQLDGSVKQGAPAPSPTP